jgi:hypothetical protein
VLVAGQEDEPGARLAQAPEDSDRQHHRVETTRIAALADERHPLVVLEPQSYGGRPNAIVRRPYSCTPLGDRGLNSHSDKSLPVSGRSNHRAQRPAEISGQFGANVNSYAAHMPPVYALIVRNSYRVRIFVGAPTGEDAS